MLVFDYGRLRECRRVLRLKQKDVAAVLHCTAATVSNMENGKVRVPADDLAVLAELYKTKINEFYVERLNYNETSK